MILDSLAGTHILITGAGGYIGSTLCHAFLAQHPASLTMLNMTESGLFQLSRHLTRAYQGTETILRYALGSVTDPALMQHLTEGQDIIIHAAAHKHVPICEVNATQAIVNNIGGTWTLIRQAKHNGVARLILISSDKAVAPASVMGATKRVAEMLATLYGYPIARLCNVYGSTGSVVPLWAEQIAQGGPVTLTDPRCERYFNSVLDVCTLILAILRFPAGPGAYMIDPGPPQNLMELAQSVIQTADVPCDIAITGLRPGEKITEELYTGPRYPVGHEGIDARIFRVETPCLPLTFTRDLIGLLQHAEAHKTGEALSRLWKLAAP